ncbi:MAG: PAS domain S-box protein, partial [Pararhodobacter sp.]
MEDGPRQEQAAVRPADGGRALVADALRLLLRAEAPPLGAVVQTLLCRLAEAVGAGRCVLYLSEGHDAGGQKSGGHNSGGQGFESHDWTPAAYWSMSGIGPAPDSLAPGSLAPAAVTALQEDPETLRPDAWLIGDTCLLPQAPLRARLVAEGVQSLAVVPLMQDGVLAGLISLEWFRTPRAISDEELWIVRTLGDSLVAAFARQQRDHMRDTALARQTEEVERLRATLAALPELMVETDGAGVCVDIHTVPDPRSPPPLSVIGRSLEETLPPDLVRLQRRVMADARRAGSARVPRYAVQTHGQERWYDTTIVHRGTMDGQERFVFRIRDVSLEQARAAENAMLVEVTRNMTNLAVVLDSELRIIWVNPAVEARTGYTLDEVRGRPVADFADASSNPEAMARLSDALLANTPCREEFFKLDRAGEPYWVDVSVQPMRDADGNPQGFMVIENDITALKQHEAELERLAQEAAQAHDRLHAAINSLQDGFAYFDADDRLVLCNERYRQMLPRSASMMVPGVSFEAIMRHAVTHGDFGGTAGQEEAWIAERLKRHRSASGGMELRLADGRWLHVFERPTPEGGRVGLRVDITALKQAEARLNDIIDSARVGTWAYDIAAGTTEINEQWWRMLGYDSNAPAILTRELWNSLIHPDDNQAMKEMLRGARSGARESVELEVRLLHRNGHRLRVLIRGRVSQRDAAGVALRISGVGLDVTERRQAEERLRVILESSAVGTWQLDCQTGAVTIDEPYAAMLGYRLEDLQPWTRERFDALVHPQDVPGLYARVSGLYGADRSDRGQEFRMRHQDGRWIWVLSFTSVQRWAAPGVPAEEGGIHIDVTERKQHEAALAEAKQALEEALAAHRLSEQRYTDIAAASHEF